MMEKLDNLKLNTSAFKVLCFLTFKEAQFKPGQIARAIGEKPSTVRARLTELKSLGLVQPGSGGYSTTVTPYDILMKINRQNNSKKS